MKEELITLNKKSFLILEETEKLYICKLSQNVYLTGGLINYEFSLNARINEKGKEQP